MVDATLPRLCLSGLQAPHRRLRLAHDERAPLRPLRPPELRQPLPAHTRPPGPTQQRMAAPGEADGRGPRGGPRLALPGLASRTASGAARRARGRPSGAARPRGRAAASTARCPLRELQRAQGPEPAAALRRALAWGTHMAQTWAPGDERLPRGRAPTPGLRGSRPHRPTGQPGGVPDADHRPLCRPPRHRRRCPGHRRRGRRRRPGGAAGLSAALALAHDAEGTAIVSAGSEAA